MVLKDKAKYYLLSAWIGMAAAHILLVFPRLNKPILGWEALVWEAPHEIATHGYAAVRFFYLPPLYDSLIAICFKCFGISEFSARLPGIACFLAMPVIIYLISKEIAEKKDAAPVGLMACALFCTAPLVIQGSLIIDRPDTTILTLVMSLFYLALLKTDGWPLPRRTLLLSVLYAVCLWTKVTTPLACLAAVPLAYFLCGRFKEGVKISAAVFVVGIALFLTTWGVFCRFLPGLHRFFEPFGYYGKAASGTVAALKSGIFSRVLLDIFRIYLWLSPFLLALGSLAIFRLFGMRPKEPAIRVKEMQLATFVCVVFLGYLYANATFSGFPKYIAPIMPILACVVAKFVWENMGNALSGKELRFFILCLLAAVVYYVIFVKDWVYAVYLLRHAQLIGGEWAVILKIIVQQALYLIFPAAALLLLPALIPMSLIKRISLALVIALLASNIALNITQRGAAYSVNFGYGTEGAEELRSFLIARQPADVFTSIEGGIANVSNVRFHGIAADIWDDPKKIMAFMEENRPECLVYGLAVNTVAQLKGTMADPAIKKYLRNNYSERGIGPYNILIRHANE